MQVQVDLQVLSLQGPVQSPFQTAAGQNTEMRSRASGNVNSNLRSSDPQFTRLKSQPASQDQPSLSQRSHINQPGRVNPSLQKLPTSEFRHRGGNRQYSAFYANRRLLFLHAGMEDMRSSEPDWHNNPTIYTYFLENATPWTSDTDCTCEPRSTIRKQLFFAKELPEIGIASKEMFFCVLAFTSEVSFYAISAKSSCLAPGVELWWECALAVLRVILHAGCPLKLIAPLLKTVPRAAKQEPRLSCKPVQSSQ